MVSALYLDVTANAAIAGREIQQLRFDITATQRTNADMETRLAELLSTRNMEVRARALGFRPSEAGEIHYLFVPGYFLAEGVRLENIAPPPAAAPSLPAKYTMSLLDWFAAWLDTPALELAGGDILP
ncbi:MAG: hypothetical protein HFACDABA_02259 [Anaerolineales bacterium]|nr:hypothetical protein [Anaerolineales bacterium]